MSIRIIKQPDVELTEAEYRRFHDEYQALCSFYCGTPPSISMPTWKRPPAVIGQFATRQDCLNVAASLNRDDYKFEAKCYEAKVTKP